MNTLPNTSPSSRKRASRVQSVAVLIALSLVLSTAGCGDEPMGPAQPNQQSPAAAAAVAKKKKEDEAQKNKEEEEKKKKDAMLAIEYTDADFIETEESRDPFRDYSFLFARKLSDNDERGQRKVKAMGYALDELRLTGIISRGRRSVMLTDPQGFGHVVYTNDYVGRAEMVNAGGTDGTEVAINWRVDRIRPQDVVFIREDTASDSPIPPTTKVMPLYPTGEEGS